jgi:uncharacterized repeat protein (TIGR01451 family)
VVVHTVTVQNVGTAAYLGATLTDELSQVLDDAVYNGDAQATTGTVSYDEPRLSWTGDVAAGETVTITYSATVRNPGTGDHLLDNAIQAPGGGTNCPDPMPQAGRLSAPTPAADRGCAHRVVVENVTISETLSPQTPRAGEVVNYTITVTNAQEASYTDAHVTDDLSGVLDDAVYNNDARASSGSVTFTGPTDDVAAPLGSASASTDDTVDPSRSATASAASTDDAVVPPGSAASAASTDDAVDSSRSAASSISTASAGPMLDWKGDLPAGSEVTITYSVTVNDPPRGDLALRNRVLGVAPGSNCSAGSADPNCDPGPIGIVLTPARTPKSASPSSPSRNPSCLRLCKPSCDRSRDSSDNRSCGSSCDQRSDSSCEGGCDSSDDRSCGSSCGRRCDSSRSSARDARSGPRPSVSALPFTGLPVVPVMLGLLLSGLGLAVRLRARRGKP